MAITGAQLNTALDYDGKPRMPRVLREFPPYGGTSQYWLIHGGQTYHGKVRRVATTASDNAATQAAAVLVELALKGNAP